MKNPTSKILKILILIDGILLALVILAAYGVVKKHDSLLASEYQLRDEKAKIANVRILSNLLADTAEDRAYLNTIFLTDKPSFVAFLESIDDIGRVSKAAVSVESGSVKFPEEKKPGTTAHVSFTAEGSWSQVAKTIGLVDHIALDSNMASLQIVKNISPESGSAAAASSGAAADVKLPKEPDKWSATFNIDIYKNPALGQ